jgi:hypothetical protein
VKVYEVADLVERKHSRLKSNRKGLFLVGKDLKLLGLVLDHGEAVQLDFVVHGLKGGVFEFL